MGQVTQGPQGCHWKQILKGVSLKWRVLQLPERCQQLCLKSPTLSLSWSPDDWEDHGNLAFLVLDPRLILGRKLKLNQEGFFCLFLPLTWLRHSYCPGSINLRQPLVIKANLAITETNIILHSNCNWKIKKNY